MVVVTTTSDARMCSEERELTGVRRFQHLNEDSPRIAMHRQLVAETVLGEEAEIGGIQGPHQADTYALRNERLPAVAERMYLVGKITDGDLVLRLDSSLMLPRSRSIENCQKLLTTSSI